MAGWREDESCFVKRIMILSRKNKVHSEKIVSLYFHLKNRESCEIEQLFTSRLLGHLTCL